LPLNRAVSAAVATLAFVALTACGGGDGVGPNQQANHALADLGTMNVGDVRVMTFADASDGLTIPASLSTAEYAVILGNSAVASSTIPQYTVAGDWLAPQGAQIASANLLVPNGGTMRAAPPLWRGAAFEARLRWLERTELPPLGTRATGAGAAAAILPPSPARAQVPTVGTTLSIKVLTAAGFSGSNGANCSATGFATTTGVVKAVGAHAIVVSDVASPAGGFSSSDFQSIANEFDAIIYPTDVGYFGTPTDLDQNGHIIIYYTPAVNKLTPAGQASVSGYVGGFFFAGDLYDPTSPPNGCLSSNKAEIFYLLAPDPVGTFGNRFDTEFVRQVSRGTVAHEFQHMINSGNRYLAGPSVQFETTWLDEGLAHFAEGAVGRVAAGLGDLDVVDFNTVTSLPDSISSAYFLQNLARAKYYVERPDTTGAIVNHLKAGANLASRGAEWSMLRYSADWFSNGDPRSFTRKLAAGPDTGTVNLAKSAGVPIDTVLAHWLVTLYTDHQGIPGLSAQYNYKSYDFQDLVWGTLIENEGTGSYLPIKAIGNGTASLQAGVPPSSASYFLTSLSNGGARTILVKNGSSAATDPNGRIYVVRQQ